MEPVTSTTRHSTDRRRLGGFTLPELLVTILILSLISGAVLSSFIFFNKSGINVGRYNDLNRQTRLALERFAVDTRMAASISSFASKQLTLVVPIDESGGSYTVTYSFLEDSYGTPELRRTFARQVTASSNTSIMPIDANPMPLVTGLAVDSGGLVKAAFRRYKVGSPTAATASSPTIPQAANNLETKQINIDIEAERRTDATIVARASNVVLSARYVLRNKVVTN